MDRVPVLLDTDAGSDIDDAVALAYLLCKPECELLGITTVTGDVQKRAAICDAVCRAAGREDIPIVCGRSETLVHGPGQPHVPHYAAISESLAGSPNYAVDGIDFLRSEIRRRPREITLLSIGPYSNVALLFAIDPEIPFLLKATVSMGGEFYAAPYAEWNCQCDPVASAMTYKASRANHTTYGLDVTRRCKLSREEVRGRFVGEPLATVLAMAELWFAGNDQLTFHDPLAAAAIFRPELCTYETGSIEVDAGKGTTRFQPGQGKDRVAKTVDREAFFQEFFSVFS